MGSGAIAAEAVSKSFTVGGEQVDILHSVSLTVSFGEMVAIMGPSGSGKSTLLYCLAGLEQPTSGSVDLLGTRLAGQSRADLAKLRRTDVGFVFQSYNLIPTLSAFENAALPYRLSKRAVPKDDLVASLTEVGLGHRVDAFPPSMSGGEQQRAALARVLGQRPRIVFADEPTGALDSRSGDQVLGKLTEIAHHPEQAVLLVTHDAAVAARCDRVLFLRDGRQATQLRPTSAAEVAETLAALTAQSAGHEQD